MQNADVPIWDKGDKTDDFAQGGSGFSFFGSDNKSDKSSDIDEAFKLVLGRKASSRELAYYRYSTLKKDDIVKKLLNGDEHKDIIEKGRLYPELEEREKLDQSTILKLKHNIEDQKSEFDEMRSMLEEKNKEISTLREEKRLPYITQSFLEGKGNIYYGNSRDEMEQKTIQKPKTWLDKVEYIIKKLSK